MTPRCGGVVQNAAMSELRSPLQARIVQWLVQPGDTVNAGDIVVILEAMKMEHEVRAPAPGTVREHLFAAGDSVEEGDLLLISEQVSHIPRGLQPENAPNSGEGATQGGRGPRADLQRVIDRHAFTLDASRPDGRGANAMRWACAWRARTSPTCATPAVFQSSTARWPWRRRASRRSAEDLMRNTPADGMVTGIGSINGSAFGPQRSRAVVMAYDATVLAGTQGMRNHQKTDRMLGLALQSPAAGRAVCRRWRWAAGRHRHAVVAGLHVTTFASFARLNGQVPVVGVVAGRCFAGNAALAGLLRRGHCHPRQQHRHGWPGHGGRWWPGRLPARTDRPGDVQHANGVIDLLVDNEAQAVAGAPVPVVFPGPR
jgi:hypothetical protein